MHSLYTYRHSAMRSASFLLLLLLLPLLSSISISKPVAVEADDEAALLAFKVAAISGGHGDPLVSWNTSTGGYCNWEGVRCGGTQTHHRRVVALNLSTHGLTGFLSPAIGNLSSLRFVNLSSNAFSGDIPQNLGRLHRLHTLDLSYNAFSGELPVNLTSCTNLTILVLESNQLRGRMPPTIGDSLTRLQTLMLWGNNFTGTIPASLANLSSLTTLSLGFNQLEGTIPSGLGSITGLQFLDVAFNSLSGELPRSLYNLSSFQVLQVQGNMFYGAIPADIGSRFPNMNTLSIAKNQFTGAIPASLSNLTALEEIQLQLNRLSGYVPSTLGKLQALQKLYLYSNRLEANDRAGWEFLTSLSNCSQLQELIITDNAAFKGQLPGSIVNLSTTLRILRFEDTGISGSIPAAISNLVSLEFLGATNTSISGAIPETIGKLENLVDLTLSYTYLSGLIPASIGNLSKLTNLFAQNAQLEGAIPASLGKLTNLVSLDLSMNHLNGSIPREILKLPLVSNVLSLSYNSLSGPLLPEVGSLGNINNLVLSGNQLSGEVPDSIGKCTVLQGLWLDDNLFEGTIPQSLNSLKGLSTLNLSMNRLYGSIPDGIGSINNLQELYLSHNNLSGQIPIVLENLTSLSELDLSFNNLNGEVPKEGIFKNLANMSITGNNDLCGGIPQLHLVPCHTNSVKKNRNRHLKYLTIALPTIGALLFLAFIAAVNLLIYKKLKQKQRSPFPPSIAEEQYDRISYHSLAGGTDEFSETNLLGKGSFGAVYKCTFQDEGIIAAVKVFNLQISGSSRSFVAECEALRRVRHRCLIKIITCCSSINRQGQEFKALVFEFMPNGSLNGWLHPESDTPAQTNTLSLEQRLDIAVDIVDALNYLHNHCEPPIVHCDLKPSNILLAEDMSARVGDFGISRILPERASKTLQNSNSTTGIRGSIGYVAPEYGEGSSVSGLGDVYSLGILLLEMFTGRSPTHDMFADSLDLHKFSEDALPDRIWEIADATMWLHTDIHHNDRRSRIENCLVSVIALGISCSKKQIRERTPVQDAATEMHDIRDSYLKFVSSLSVEQREEQRSAVICRNSE